MEKFNDALTAVLAHFTKTVKAGADINASEILILAQAADHITRAARMHVDVNCRCVCSCGSRASACSSGSNSAA